MIPITWRSSRSSAATRAVSSPTRASYPATKAGLVPAPVEIDGHEVTFEPVGTAK
ncbi:hypothetical protein M2322_002835 [Rhodoblastus acidophilus]|nr:hypothetical protein [Rhodoblastus acidophilus]